MDTRKLKAYAPKARVAFMQAVTKRAAMLGLYENRISDVNVQGDNAIIEGRIFTRKQGQQRNQLVSRIENLGTVNGKLNLKDGFNQFINEVAFTWFNRLTAIRYMEINGYLEHGFRVLSKSENATFEQGFEILSHAADVAEDLGLDKTKIVEMMLDGDQEEELYREILLGQCHHLSTIMPFMFEKLDGATELLLPDNLTKTDSILKDLVDELSEDNWRDIENDKGQIEVIGWLYQFYISEQKEAVMGKVVKREDIPAATQLFTPNWIVKYLVQNSVGRQWLATYPESELKDKMEYYITPAEQSAEVIEQLKAITPTSIDPETIKVLDPACGSGHILVEVYEVLREIYLERGYRLREIPELILTKNIYGLDIDERAAQMSAFALLMKAREDDKRIFSRIADSDIQLNIYAIQSTENLNIDKLWLDLDFEGKQKSNTVGELFAEPQLAVAETSAEYQVYLNLLRYLKTQFIDAKNLGSLIEVDNKHLNVLVDLKAKLLEKKNSNHQSTREAVEALLPIVEQAILLSTIYDVAIANPPYMGSKGMNAALRDFAKKEYPDSKSDLFAMFMERAFKFLTDTGYNAQVNMQSWMFLSSYKNIRESMLNTKSIITMAHLGARAFRQITGEVVQTTAWVFNNNYLHEYQPSYLRLIDGDEEEKNKNLLNKNNVFNETKQTDFKRIPGSPVSYWMGEKVYESFDNNPAASTIASSRAGMTSGDNDYFTRQWHEIDFSDFTDECISWEQAIESKKKWFPYNKGGAYKKWFGNITLVIRYDKESRDKLKKTGNNCASEDCYFKEGATWTDLTSGRLGARFLPSGSIFDIAGHCLYPEVTNGHFQGLALLNTSFANDISKVINATMHFQPGDYRKLPYPKVIDEAYVTNLAKNAIKITEQDWHENEFSWLFKTNRLISVSEDTIRKGHESLLLAYKARVLELRVVEEENNKIFLKAFDLLSKYDIDVPVEQITLESNPDYKYSAKSLTSRNRDDKFRSQVITNLLSYVIGNVMGRYSLDREGLIYAHSENKGFKELVSEGAYKTFSADDDGILPLAAEEWLFEDDATSLFREFVKTVWGEEHLTENLDFVAESLCLDAIKPRKGEGAMDTIRRYFSTQFYKDHLKTYKKRPIYWMFSSGKEKAFECLVYLHRYNESTLARMRTEYVTPLMGKMETQLSLLAESAASSTSTSEKARLTKELKSLEKKQAELRAFDEELKHLAEMKINLDLDDGVKVNYGKFGNLLADVKAIHGKNPERIV
ncbi:BREX-1 system adenine-specific DNA-methyltransferase PglX [Oceanisphaera ostreae]|uniref:site-specific DNA-methyltransferase (adenine-specific) n=1 Tax=Oceanisphaera ostreae TaxID=914151 RepID=A0ABW3KCB2_9GAMM